MLNNIIQRAMKKQAILEITIAVAIFTAVCVGFWWLNTNYPMLGMAAVIATAWVFIYKVFYSEQSQKSETNDEKKVNQ